MAAYDAPLMLIDYDANFEQYFKSMESYALHHVDYHKSIKFSHEVVRFYNLLSSVHDLDAKFARLALNAVQISSRASIALRRYLREHGSFHGIEEQISGTTLVGRLLEHSNADLYDNEKV